jgi:hypothetical protein
VPEIEAALEAIGAIETGAAPVITAIAALVAALRGGDAASIEKQITDTRAQLAAIKAKADAMSGGKP